MKFKRVRKFTGGVLGEMSEATNAVQKSLEKIRAVSPIRFIHENNSIAISARSGEKGGSTGDYAFKVTAVINQNKTFTVNVLGGTAQTLGGTPHFYEDAEIPDAEDGDYIFLRYQNVDSNWIEVGTWDSDVHYGTAAYIENTYGGAPFDLIFVIGRVGSDYAGFVRQDHKGNIVMPAISNVVDIQTQLP
jgi:hypothetical protein